jgi:hypothetical protein
MSRNIIIIFGFISFILTSCISDPDGYLKRSGNRKLVSNNNVYGQKRMPVQNKKYIQKAKRNIVENNYEDEEEEDEYNQNPSLINRKLYIQMIEQEKAHKLQEYRRDRALREIEMEEKERQAQQKIIQSTQEAQKAQKDLQLELQNIKAVLNETKEQMASITCKNKIQDNPQKDQEVKPRETIKEIVNKKIDNLIQSSKERSIKDNVENSKKSTNLIDQKKETK